MQTTNRPRFTAMPDQTEPGRKVLCSIVDWDGGHDAPDFDRTLIGGLTPREAVVGAHVLDELVRALPYPVTPEMVDALVAFRFPHKARPLRHEEKVCGKETRHPQSRVTSLCRLPNGHAGMCEA